MSLLAQRGEPVEQVPAAEAAADTVRQPAVPLPKVDSVPARDSVKAPLAVAERPRAPDVSGRRVVWDRAAIFGSGALTLPELLEQVPGATVGRAGFIAGAAVASWYGQPGRVRVFLDGLEIDELDPRSGGVAELSRIQLWAMEEVAVERAAGELRVHLRTWRVQLTTPQTRTDVLTGAENTNLYRGFYGKRFHNGGVLQLAAQQYSTVNGTVGADGDALAAFLRAGIARGDWSVDAVALRFGRTRLPTRRFVLAGQASADPDAIPRFKGRDVTAYVRAAFRNADSTGLWATVQAGTIQSIEDDSTGGATADADTVVSQSQWVGALGYTRGAFRASGTARLRAQGGDTRFAPALRTSWDGERLGLSAYAELAGPDSTRRIDVLGRLQVFRWLHLGAAASQHAPDDAAAEGPARLTTRGELGLTWRDRWLTVGVVQRGEARVGGMPLFDADYVAEVLPAATGLEIGLRGPVLGPVSFAWRGTDWGEEALYRSSLESRAEMRVETDLRKYLPRAKFHLTFVATHEYRNDFLAPDGNGGTVRAKGASALGTLLDLRIGSANVFWYNRNFTGKAYETIPGYLMPRLVQLYGIRWEFWN